MTHLTNSLKLPACRYTNVAWSDCDLDTWMRKKVVHLLAEEEYQKGSGCPDTREFSQTCTEAELPKGPSDEL